MIFVAGSGRIKCMTNQATAEKAELSALQETPLHDVHVELGAKMVDFGGWHMPLQYSKVKEEHTAVRTAAGLFDVSHMGLVTVNGPDTSLVQQSLNGLIPQDLSNTPEGKAVYTQFLNEQGGILDDLIIYHIPQSDTPDSHQAFQQWLVVCNASNAPNDIAWMKQHLNPEINVELLSSDFSLLALQGPKFKEILEKTGANLESLPSRFHIASNTLLGKPVMLGRTGYTGEDGVEIIVKNDDVKAIWNGLLSHHETTGILPIGLAARDTLRLEAAYPLHGHDIDPTTSPLAAGLGWSVKLQQDGDFIGKAALVSEKKAGSTQKFVCLELQSKAIARQFDEIHLDDSKIGTVTSGSIAPHLNIPIAMGYIEKSSGIKVGDTVQIAVRNKKIDALVVKRPFYTLTSV